MALTSYNFRKGVDIPVFEWMSFFPAGITYHGTSVDSDGVRYIYYAIQYGTTAVTASTTQLWRFDTWTNGWILLTTLTSGNRGIDINYDQSRNVLWIIYGAALTEWRYFNLNLSQVTVAGLTTAAFTLSTAITTVLPAGADYGASITVPNDTELVDQFDSGTAASGSTATNIIEDTTGSEATFHPMMVGLYIEFTSGTLNGQRRLITAVATNGASLTCSAFGSAPSAGDAFKVVLPRATASSATASTLTLTSAGWTVNLYANSDVEIVSGTGAGQRRRIASNTADTLTLAGAVAGAARTGNWSVTPDNTSVFVIKPSNDFIYYQPGSTNANLYRIDIEATTKAWTTLTAVTGAPSSGGDLKYPRAIAPFNLLQIRGNATNNVYYYNIGLNTWTTLTTYWGGETLTTGACTCMIYGKRRVMMFKEAAQRVLVYKMVTGDLEAGGTIPYAAPAGYDGKRAVYMKTPDGVEWVYWLRAGGQEFLRVPLEWL